jgi:hypothetical protein
MQDTPTVELVVPSPTNKWTQPTLNVFLFLAPPIMCTSLDVLSPLPLSARHLSTTSPLIRQVSPLYNLPIDQTVYSELLSTGHFEQMSPTMDEEEHSIEMHLPYIAKV